MFRLSNKYNFLNIKWDGNIYFYHYSYLNLKTVSRLWPMQGKHNNVIFLWWMALDKKAKTVSFHSETTLIWWVQTHPISQQHNDSDHSFPETDIPQHASVFFHTLVGFQLQSGISLDTSIFGLSLLSCCAYRGLLIYTLFILKFLFSQTLIWL